MCVCCVYTSVCVCVYVCVNVCVCVWIHRPVPNSWHALPVISMQQLLDPQNNYCICSHKAICVNTHFSKYTYTHTHTYIHTHTHTQTDREREREIERETSYIWPWYFLSCSRALFWSAVTSLSTEEARSSVMTHTHTHTHIHNTCIHTYIWTKR